MMELTDGMIEDAISCKQKSCIECGMPQSNIDMCCEALALALQAERAKPKVWDGAQKWQDRARIKFYTNSALCAMDETFQYYTRELPKTRAREIAEESAKTHLGIDQIPEHITKAIESAILVREKELGV